MGDPRNDRETTLRILDAVYAARECGEVPDLETLCEGDAPLRERIDRLLGMEPSLEGLALAAMEGDEGELFPTELGDFKTVAFLGRGGMGCVYLAEQQAVGRLVALKVLDQGPLGDPRARARFRREAELAGSLEHPNIVPIYAAGEEAGYSYIAMKWLTGPALDQLDGPLAPREVGRIGVAVGCALADAHASGVVHRDVKPSNVILDADEPILVDFGLARLETSGASLTRQGTVPGTLPYLAPELLEPGATRVDGRCDVYALGATLYELVRGAPAFAAENTEKLLRSILTDEPPRLGLRGQDKGLEIIIYRAMDKDPGRRFQTAGQFVEDLERYLAHEPITSRRSSVWFRTLRWVRLHRRVTASVSVLLVSCVVLLASWVVQRISDNVSFESDARAGSEALVRGELPVARAYLDSMRKKRPEHARTRALAERMAAAVALEALLDQVQDLPACQNPTLLKRLAADVENSGSRRFWPRDANVALALAALYAGDPKKALACIDAAEAAGGPGLGTVALRAVIGRREVPPSSEALIRSPDEHLFAALALRYAGDPEEAQLRELTAAWQLDPAHYRVQYALALIRLRTHEFGAARAALMNVAREGREHWGLHRDLAWLDVQEGRPLEAQEHLSRIPPDRRAPYDDVIELLGLWRAGQLEPGQVEELFARWSDDAEVLLFCGQWEAEQGHLDEALTHLANAERHARWYFQRNVARITSLALRLIKLGTGPNFAGSVSTQEARDKVEPIAAEAAELAKTARNAVNRSRALWVQGWASLVLLRPREEVLALFDASSEACIDHANPRHSYIDIVWHELDGSEPEADVAPALLARVRRASRFVEEILAWEGRGRLPPTLEQTEDAEACGARLARWLLERQRCGELARRALHRLNASPGHRLASLRGELMRWAVWSKSRE